MPMVRSIWTLHLFNSASLDSKNGEKWLSILQRGPGYLPYLVRTVTLWQVQEHRWW